MRLPVHNKINMEQDITIESVNIDYMGASEHAQCERQSHAIKLTAQTWIRFDGMNS